MAFVVVDAVNILSGRGRWRHRGIHHTAFVCCYYFTISCYYDGISHFLAREAIGKLNHTWYIELRRRKSLRIFIQQMVLNNRNSNYNHHYHQTINLKTNVRTIYVQQ